MKLLREMYLLELETQSLSVLNEKDLPRYLQLMFCITNIMWW